MTTAVTLPKMGESVVEGTILRWLKKEGDWVEIDEPLVEISTDKIDAELPSPAAGVLTQIKVGPDETVEVGTELAVIDETAEKGGAKAPPKASVPKADAAKAEPATPASAPAAEPATKAKAPAAKEAARATTPATAPAETGDGHVQSPLVRKLARERGVDLSTVRGTGSGGRVTKEDVLAAAGGAAPPSRATADRGTARAPAPAPAPSAYAVPSDAHQDVPFSRVRRAIAEHMVRSKRTAAHLTNVVEVDMTGVASLRARAKGDFARQEGFSLTFVPFVASAIVQGLRSYPEFNAHVLEDGATARLFRQVNLGIAVGRDEGLIVPIVHGADGMNLIGLARAVQDIASRARTKGGLKPDDVTGGTFTLSNYGSLGGLMDTPIISQPQVAILGMGSVVKRAAVIDVDGADAIAIRHMMYLSLSYDHRWLDGHKAAQFNSRVKQVLEEAEFAGDLGLE